MVQGVKRGKTWGNMEITRERRGENQESYLRALTLFTRERVRGLGRVPGGGGRDRDSSRKKDPPPVITLC